MEVTEKAFLQVERSFLSFLAEASQPESSIPEFPPFFFSFGLRPSKND